MMNTPAYLTVEPGAASARIAGDGLLLENAVLSVRWDLTASAPRLTAIVDRLGGRADWPQESELFRLTMEKGGELPVSRFRQSGPPALARLEPLPGAVRIADRFGGWLASLELWSADGRVRIQWRGILRDGSNYARQELTVSAQGADLPLREVALLDLRLPDAAAVGTVRGSPLLAGTVFAAAEHPMAQNRIENGSARCSVPRHRALQAGETWTVSSVIGVVPDGQRRRGFLYYLERERARPYDPFAYYISWLDIAGPDRKMTAPECVAAIETFGREMVTRRGARLSAFVFDDGWDDNATLWGFNAGFPEGFAPLRAAAETFGARLGTWISPFGGYDAAKRERLKFGVSQGFETNRVGFSLAGPTYYRRFREVCARMIAQEGIRYLKFDGIGEGVAAEGPGAEFGADIEAMLQLIEDLRVQQPDLFVNTTVGTWPSPFWLRWSDTTWRGGGDIGYMGRGTPRQQWLTYRDAQGYRVRMERGPFYPLNSLKFQSVLFARLSHLLGLSHDANDLMDDVWMAAGSGTQVQEFFVTPAMLTSAGWDAIAGALKFMRRHAGTLVDTHGIGGDPAEGEPYGYASWSPQGAVLTLRNPGERPARLVLDPQTAFELPADAPRSYTLSGPSNASTARSSVTLSADRPQAFDLAPFEVQVWETCTGGGTVR